VDFTQNPYDDEEEPASSVPAEGLKIELEILKSKLDQVKREFELYKSRNPQSPAKTARDSFQQKQAGQTIPAELQISRTNLPTNEISKSSIFITKEQEIETVLRTVETRKQNIYESQEFDHPKPVAQEKPAETKKSTADLTTNLGSSIISKEQTEERKKILERVELNMSNLMKSSLGQSSIGGSKTDKNDPENLLKRALKEYTILQIRIKELKKKNLDLSEKQEAAQNELQAGRDAQIEPKLSEEVESRLKKLLEEKEKHLAEYRGTADLETQLRKKLMDLIAQVEEVEKKKQESEKTQATRNTLAQSKLLLDAPQLLEPPADPRKSEAGAEPVAVARASEPASRERALHLEVKHVQTKPAPGAPSPDAADKPAEPSRAELEAKQKSKKQMNEKLSRRG
jgi:hypothetical protein